MRLINTSTLDFGEFVDDIPQYAILSHTWEKTGEMRHEQWIDREKSPITHLSGYQKILGACHKARSHKMKWLWVDTICIDKRSSAELSEAINSMFDWYHESIVCYVYMADVQASETNIFETIPKFARSRWFTRGWTLQELLAPKHVVFFDSYWIEIGTRNGSLLKIISEVTKIHEDALSSVASMSFMSIAAKMSWLSRRRTTRIEDMAYCMLGIFDLNMPLLYGEGGKAFIRLQEEIIKKSSDQSIFCWAWNDDVPVGWTSILSPSPSTFRWAADFAPINADDIAPYHITNRGLSIRLHFGYSIWSTGCFWVSLSVMSEEAPLCRAYLPMTWSSTSGHQKKTYRRQAWPPKPMMLMNAQPVMQISDLWIETLPTRFPRHVMGSNDFRMPNISHPLNPFEFGIILLLPCSERSRTLGPVTRGFESSIQTLLQPQGASPGLFVLSNSKDGRASVSSRTIISFSNGRKFIYVGVKRIPPKQTGESSAFVWYFKSWKAPYRGASNVVERALQKADFHMKCIEDEQLDPQDSLKMHGVYVNIGDVVDLGATGESRVICLGDDLQPLLITEEQLMQAGAADAMSDAGSIGLGSD